MLSTDEIDGVLGDNEYFAGLDPEARRALAEICLARKLAKNAVLFHEGQKGYGFFLLVSGAVQVSKTTEGGREVVIKVLKPGEVFAEVVLFEQSEYPARAHALKESLVLVIPKKQIECLLDDPKFRNAFIGLFLKKLRYLTDRILYLTLHDVEERFFMFLEDHWGKKREYHIDLSKKDFAAAIGANPETFSRLVARLESAGLISWEKKKLMLLKPKSFGLENPPGSV